MIILFGLLFQIVTAVTCSSACLGKLLIMELPFDILSLSLCRNPWFIIGETQLDELLRKKI